MKLEEMTKEQLIKEIDKLNSELEENDFLINTLGNEVERLKQLNISKTERIKKLNNKIEELIKDKEISECIINELQEELLAENSKLQEQKNDDWCSIGIAGYSGNYAYIPIMNKPGYKWEDELWKAWVEYMEFFSKLTKGEIPENEYEGVDEVTIFDKLIAAMKPVLGISLNRDKTIGIYNRDVMKMTKHEQLENWYKSIDRRYGTYIKNHGYDYWKSKGVDLNKPVKMIIEHACPSKMDQHNLNKQFIDYLYKTMKENSNGKMTGDDVLIDELQTKRIANSEEYFHTSEIRWRFENIEPVTEYRSRANWYLGKKIS